MATVAGPSKQHAKYDEFVEAQLEKARKRIRSLDVMTALLGFAAGTLAYAVVMALLDNWLTLPPAALYSAFFVYLAGALVYLGLTVVRPLTASINPYFAARQVEQTLPGAKNSVVNWLDLHADEKLPTAIHGAVSQRAARDLAKADLDKAVSSRRASWMGGVVAGLCAVLLVLLFSLGARKLFSHLGRAFLPFSGQGVAKRTEIVILEPEGGNASIAADQQFTVRARVNGRVPETLKLIVQRTRTDPEQEYFLDRDKGAPGEWVLTMSASEVKNGFFYRVVGGDASTEEFRLDVRSTPAILADRFTATYRNRPYFGQRVERAVRKERTLRDFRGTTVTLDVPTNRKLKSGEVVLLSTDQKKTRTIPAQIVAGNETALKARFVLEWSGSYFIQFTSVEGERYADAPPFPIEAREDTPPQVSLTEPGKDESLAADALLKLKGTASDDVGVKELTLRLKTADGITLKPKPYRSPEALKLADGGYPNHVDYQDFLDLAQVKDEAGKAFPLKPGMVLEYWLEARDGCDYPEPKAGNVAESKHYKVTIIDQPPRDQKKKEQERQQAKKEQEQHEKKQDQEKQKQNQERRQQDKKQEDANKEARDQAKENQQGGKGQDRGEPKDKKGGEGPKDDRTPEQKKKDEENRKKQERLNDAATKAEEERRQAEEKAEQQRRENQKSSAKGDGKQGKRGEAKGDPDNGNKDNDNQPDKSEKQDHGKGKGASPQDKKGEKENKAKPQPEKDAGHDQGTGKGKGKPEKGSREQASSKDNAGMKDGEQPAQGKDDPKKQQRDGRAQGKSGGEQKPGEKQENKAKPEGSKASEAKGKDGGKPDKSGQPKADKKDAGGKEGDKQATAKDGKEQGKDQKQQAKSDGRGEAKGDEGRQQEKSGQDTAKGAGKSKPEQAKGAGKDGGKKGKEEKAAAKDGQGQQGEKRADAKDGARQGDRKEPERGTAKGGKGQSGEKQAAQEKTAQGQGEKSKGKEGGKEQTADNKRSTAKGEPKQQQAKGQCKDCKGGQSAGAGKPSAKGNTQAKSETKPTGGDGGSGTATAKDDRVKGDPHGKAAMKKPADEVTRKDVEELAKDLNSNDPKVRRDAERKLDEVSRDGKESVRQAAEDKLGEARGGKSAATVKKTPGEGQKPGQPKDDPTQGQKTVKAKGPGEGQAGQPKKGEQTADAGRGKHTGGRGRQLDAPPEDLKSEDADGRFKDRAGALQLDKFDEKVRKKILKDAGLTEEQYQQLKEDLKRRPLPPPAPDPTKTPVVGRDGKPLGTTGAVRVRSGNDKPGVNSSDEGLPPLEYRDAYKRFTRELGK